MKRRTVPRRTSPQMQGRQKIDSPIKISLISMVDPDNKEKINLEDMNSILERIPEPTREVCQDIFNHYICNSFSMLMPVETFLERFDRFTRRSRVREEEVPEQPEEKPRAKSAMRGEDSVSKVPVVTQAQILKKRIGELSKERSFIKYDSEILGELLQQPKPSQVKRSSTPVRAKSETSQFPNRLHEGSYYQISKRQREVKARKITPVKQRTIQKYDTVDGTSLSSFLGNTDFRDTFNDPASLIDVRRAHLKYTLATKSYREGLNKYRKSV